MSKARGFGSGEGFGFDDLRERPTRRERSAKHRKQGMHDSGEPSRSQRLRALRKDAQDEWEEDWQDDADDDLDPWGADEDEEA